jgi:magnesium chelatase family protein
LVQARKLALNQIRVVRILKVARTVADLEGAEDLEPKHLSEAVQYRTLDRNLWV